MSKIYIYHHNDHDEHEADKPAIEYNVGDKVWFIKTFQEIYWKSGMFRLSKTKTPFEKKITQVIHTKDGTLYQVKGGHFHESWIGKIVFNTKDEAQEMINKNYN